MNVDKRVMWYQILVLACLYYIFKLRVSVVVIFNSFNITKLTFAKYFYIVVLTKAAVRILFCAFQFCFFAANHLQNVTY